jgi:predicted metal-dependent hydrolase
MKSFNVEIFGKWNIGKFKKRKLWESLKLVDTTWDELRNFSAKTFLKSKISIPKHL